MVKDQIIILVISTLIGLGCFIYIWFRDYLDREPFFYLLLTSIFGGASSFALYTTAINSLNFEEIDFINIFIFYSPLEEISKFIVFIIAVRLLNKYFDDLTDGIIYISVISLGFALIENYYLILNTHDDFEFLFFCTLANTLSKVAVSFALGIAYFIHIKIHKNYMGLCAAFIISITLNSLNQLIIISPILNEFLLKLIYGLSLAFYSYIFYLSKSLSNKTPEISIINLKETKSKGFFYCASCNSAHLSNKYKLSKVKMGKCPSCNLYLLNGESLGHLKNIFMPFKTERERFFEDYTERITYIHNNPNLILNTKRWVLAANLDDLNNFIKIENSKYVNNEMKSDFYRVFLNLLGFNYIISNKSISSKEPN